MKRVIIVGGGLAGLSCAVYLSKAGIDVKVIESSPKLGGRAYSFIEKVSGQEIDNGQHIMMGCYDNTLDLLDILKMRDKLYIQDKLDVTFVDHRSKQFSLSSKSDLYPLNLLRAILNYNAIPVKDRMKVLDLFLDLIYLDEEDVKEISVYEWLKSKGQTENSIKSLWQILAIGTLNSNIKEASAAVFVHILKRMFLDGNQAAKIVIPEIGLSKLFCEPAENYLLERQVQINYSERLDNVIFENGRAVKLITSKNEISDFSHAVLAVPNFALEKIEITNYDSFPQIDLKYSPIISINIWLKKNIFNRKFYGFIDSPVHWLFNHESHVTLVTSAAYDWAGLEENFIKNIVFDELESIFPVFSRDLVLIFKLIKEKRATFVPSPSSILERDKIEVSIGNLLLAGDWTELMLPATIESAVLSGRKSASAILNE